MKTNRLMNNICSIIKVVIIVGLVPWTGFAQTLDDYLDQAVENHPRLNAVEAERQSALERAKQASYLPDPMLTAGVFLFPVETRVGPQRGNISAMQQFPWFGTLDAREEVHLAEARTEESNLENERILLERAVRKAFYDLYDQGQKIVWQRELIESLYSIERLAEVEFSEGKGSMADVVRVRIEIEDAEYILENLEERDSALLARFNAVMHRPAQTPVRYPDTLEMHPPAIPVADRWRNHPEYTRFQRMQSEWEAKRKVTDKKSKPTIGLGLNYIVTAERDLPELEDNGKDALLPMLQVRVPIFSKKYDAENEALRLKSEAVQYRRESWKDKWNSRVEQLEYDMQQANNRYDLLNRQIENTQRATRLLISAYQNADADIDEVLRMEIQRIRYRQEQVESLVRYNKAKADLMYLINQIE